MSERYKIVRFFQNKPEKIIKENVSLPEAQAHCEKESTHGPGWFDGYREQHND